MKSNRKRKALYWIFKVLSVIVSCAFPIWAILERYPLWIETEGKSQAIGVGSVLVVIVLLIIFRKTIVNFIRDRLKLHHAPPLVVWLALLIVSYVLIYISQFLQDLNAVLWMGFIGCGIGVILTLIAENAFGVKKVVEEEKADE